MSIRMLQRCKGGAFSSTAPAPSKEQWRQGWELMEFYGTISAGENFCVEVVP
jgi:hypothetical protein